MEETTSAASTIGGAVDTQKALGTVAANQILTPVTSSLKAAKVLVSNGNLAKVGMYDPNLHNYQLFTQLKNGTTEEYNKARGDILLGPDGFVYAISKYSGSANKFSNGIYKISPVDGQAKQELWRNPALPALRGLTSGNAGDANDMAFKGACGVAGTKGSGACVLLVAVASGVLRLNYRTGAPAVRLQVPLCSHRVRDH